MEGSFKREGTYRHLWLIHVVLWQKPRQHSKAIVLQLRILKSLLSVYIVKAYMFIKYKFYIKKPCSVKSGLIPGLTRDEKSLKKTSQLTNLLGTILLTVGE